MLSKAAYTCLGVDIRGRKEILGIWVGENEGAHFWLAIRNSLKYIASKYQKEFMVDLKPVYQATTEEKARLELKNLSQKWGNRYPLVIKSWEKNWADPYR